MKAVNIRNYEQSNVKKLPKFEPRNDFVIARNYLIKPPIMAWISIIVLLFNS